MKRLLRASLAVLLLMSVASAEVKPIDRRASRAISIVELAWSLCLAGANKLTAS